MIKATIRLMMLQPGRLRNEANKANVIKLMTKGNIDKIEAIVERMPGAFSTKPAIFPCVVALFISCLQITT